MIWLLSKEPRDAVVAVTKDLYPQTVISLKKEDTEIIKRHAVKGHTGYSLMRHTVYSETHNLLPDYYHIISVYCISLHVANPQKINQEFSKVIVHATIPVFVCLSIHIYYTYIACLTTLYLIQAT